MENQRIVLVTGAKGGLGSFVTETFLAAGDLVIGTSKSVQASDFASPNFVAMPSDLTDAASTAKLVDSAIQRFQKIDVLVHVMGGFSGGKPIAETDDATWDRMMSLNLRSGFNILRAVIPHMREAGRGRIVAIASRAAAEPAPNIAAYAASKAGLVSLVRAAALENKDHRITVNAILPGTMNTDANRGFNPGADFSRWVPPENVAEVVAFLASDAAAEITGAAIPIYGKEA
jgi:NAD(P)-dependent dehydrogenase (short-subunit alcohol dehydrogenase family)